MTLTCNFRNDADGAVFIENIPAGSELCRWHQQNELGRRLSLCLSVVLSCLPTPNRFSAEGPVSFVHGWQLDDDLLAAEHQNKRRPSDG